MGIIAAESDYTPARALLPAIRGGSTPDPKMERAGGAPNTGELGPHLAPQDGGSLRPGDTVEAQEWGAKGLSLISLSWTLIERLQEAQEWRRRDTVRADGSRLGNGGGESGLCLEGQGPDGWTGQRYYLGRTMRSLMLRLTLSTGRSVSWAGGERAAIDIPF